MSQSPSVSAQLNAAVLQNGAETSTGLLERLFSQLFHGLVYAQIWEDPEVDMAALNLAEGEDIICIASGGCNAMSYLTARPGSLTAVDLSPAHIALLELKTTAARVLTQDEFESFFAGADSKANLALYDRCIAPVLDADSRRFWEGRAGLRRRISIFGRGAYRFGLLGRFIGAAHLVARIGGVDFAPLLRARTLGAQRDYFERELAPLFDKPTVQWLARRRAALFGLGIPPAQYDKLARDGGGDVLPVLKERLRKLVCDFPIGENYFAWQAFARHYEQDGPRALPPYLAPASFDTVARMAPRVTALNRSMTDVLAAHSATTLDAYVLLDAQDWMNDDQLNDLWLEITRTARPGARVIFRTGGADDILPGRVRPETLGRWTYDRAASEAGFAADRSAIYGGFHLYRFEDDEMSATSQPTSHAELMDETYRYQRLFYDLTRRYYLLGRDHLIRDLAPGPRDRVLEVACGTGRNLARIARAYPGRELFGLDISREMLRTAEAKLGTSACLAQGDACSFDGQALFNRQRFDRIVISFGLSMIPDWEAAVTTAAAHLRPGGALHMVDFGDQAGLPRGFRRMLLAWLARFHVSPREDMEERLWAIARTQGLTLEHRPLFRGYSQYAVLRRP